jgi:four helix bundle protein
VGNFRRLDVYRRACVLSDRARESALRWDSFDRWTIGIQLVRSADSIAANIAEGSGRFHLRDERRFMLIARGSAFETEHWLRRAVERGLVPDDGLEQEAREISRMLGTLSRIHDLRTED